MPRSLWSAAEIETLQELSGDYPFGELCRLYNTWASRQGLKKRSAQAIRSACYRHGAITLAAGEWLTARSAGLLLEGSSNLVIYWIHRGWLPARRLGEARNSPYYVRRTDLRRLARQRPELFAGRTRATLIQALCSEELADRISEAFPVNVCRPQRVQRLDTGQAFPSIQAAARAHGIGRTLLQTALRERRAVCGTLWRPLSAA